MTAKRLQTQVWAAQTYFQSSRMNEGSQQVQEKIKYMSNITNLSLVYTDLTPSIADIVTPNLKQLEVCNVADLTLETFGSLLSKCGANLERLRIAEQRSLCQGDGGQDSVYTLLSKYCPNLVYLEVREPLGNTGLDQLASKCLKIETVLLPNDADVSKLSSSPSLKCVSSRSRAISKYIEHPFIIEGSMRAAEWEHNNYGDQYTGQIPLRDAINAIMRISPQKVGINLLYQNWNDNETSLLFEALRVEAPREALDLLVAHGANPHLITPTGHSAFYYVKSTEGLKFLVDCGLDLRVPVYQSVPYCPNVLEYCFIRKEWVLIKELLSEELYPKIQQYFPMSVLLLLLQHYEDDETHEAFLHWILKQKRLGISTNDRTIFHTCSGGPLMAYVGSGAASLTRSDLGYTCLHIACQKGLPEKVLRILLAAGADPFALAADGASTPLACAVSFPRFDSNKNHSDAIRVMMELHKGQEHRLPPTNAKHCPEAEFDFFGGCWNLGRLDIIRTLISRMVDPKKELGSLLRGPQGYFSLACGNCLQDNGELVLELLDNGFIDKDILNKLAAPDSRAFNVRGQPTALWNARALPHLVPVLLQRGAEITPTISTNIGNYDAESMKLLLATGKVQLELVDYVFGRNVFSSALSSVEKLEILWQAVGEHLGVQKRSDMIKHMSTTPQSLIHIAVEDAKQNNMEAKTLLEVVTWLVEHGADIRATDQNGNIAAQALADQYRYSDDIDQEDLEHFRALLKLLDPEGAVASPFDDVGGNRGGFVTAEQLDAFFRNAFAVPEGSKNVIL